MAGAMTPVSFTASIVGKVTLQSRSGKQINYALSLPKQGLVAGLSIGDRVQMMVTIPAAGFMLYGGVLEGTVVHVTKNRVKIYIYATYRPIIEHAYRERLPVLVHAVVKKGS